MVSASLPGPSFLYVSLSLFSLCISLTHSRSPSLCIPLFLPCPCPPCTLSPSKPNGTGRYLQGVVKPALGRLRDATASRAQELLEEALALQERRDAGNHILTERTEENALLGVQVLLTPFTPSDTATL
jgi:hypothetical protein